MLDTAELEEKALTWQKGEGRRIEKVRGVGETHHECERGIREPSKPEAGLNKLEFALHSRARSVL